MKFVYFFIWFISSLTARAQQSFQLAAPFIKYPTIFFDKELSVVLAFEQPGAQIRYTVDGSAPHAKSKQYQQPVVVYSNMVTIKARSFARGFTASETEQATFIKNGRPLTVNFPAPEGAYRGTGPNTLTDNKGGITDHTSKTWLGYDAESVSIIIKLNGRPVLQELLFNTLQNQEAWIFCPSKAAVYIQNTTDANNWQLFQTIIIPPNKSADVICKAFKIPLKKTKAHQLKLVLFNTALPAWHQGAGANGWMFIDEIKVY